MLKETFLEILRELKNNIIVNTNDGTHSVRSIDMTQDGGGYVFTVDNEPIGKDEEPSADSASEPAGE